MLDVQSDTSHVPDTSPVLGRSVHTSPAPSLLQVETDGDVNLLISPHSPRKRAPVESPLYSLYQKNESYKNEILLSENRIFYWTRKQTNTLFNSHNSPSTYRNTYVVNKWTIDNSSGFPSFLQYGRRSDTVPVESLETIGDSETCGRFLTETE